MPVTADVTILTASMPERSAMLAEAIESVHAQRVQPAEHLIAVDWSVNGFVDTINRLASIVETYWLMVLPDDDLIDVDHLETLTTNLRDEDVVYSWCRSEGRDGWVPNTEFDAQLLRGGNFIPGGACLIRTKLWQKLDGYRKTQSWDSAEDWDFWIRALDLRAKFKCVPRVTWTYRFHGRNLSCGELPARCK
jgi:hypothetical protein